MNTSARELDITDLRLELLSDASTEESDEAAVIGQSRATAALSLGLGIQSRGYNVFIMGQPGTGRRTALKSALNTYIVNDKNLQDKTYVFNFRAPSEPRHLAFPRGRAAEFKKAVHDLVEDIKKIVDIHDASDAFAQRRTNLVSTQEKTENQTLSAFEADLAAAGFRIVQVSDGTDLATDIVPLRDGEAISFDALQALVSSGTMTQGAWNALREQYYGFMDRMKNVFQDLKRTRADLDRSVRELREEMLQPIIASQIDVLKREFPGEKTVAWLTDLGEDIVSHLFLFTRARQDQEQPQRRRRMPPLARYGVNILIDRSGPPTPPVVFENRPTLANLMGTIDMESEGAEDGRGSYLKIRGGSLLKASGGVLVLRAEDIVEDEAAWPYLKRVLQTGKLEIQPTSGPFGGPAHLKPEPIDLHLKVVMIGGELSYDLLYQADPDFQKLFKVCAEFDCSVDRTAATERTHLGFFRKIVREEGLLPLSADGTRAILEHSVRLAEHRDRLSTRFSLIADLLREADWCARREGRGEIDAAAVLGAREQRKFLQNLPEAKLASMISAGEILIELSGTAVGKANGLAVHDRGYYAFGCPVVVSARVAPGDGGVVNIEGESGLSGEIFDKAILILSGYLRSKYAHNFPLSVTASVCFEQSYTAIDGDSATLVQLCTIISAISGIPLRQDLAVTGSVNQLGFVQPVGGVSEKVEGFFSICRQGGLTGTQGVVVPRRNVGNLVLARPVLEAVEEGRFHLYAVDSIDQALELLSGVESGREEKDGTFPSGTLNAAVLKELHRMASLIHRFET